MPSLDEIYPGGRAYGRFVFTRSDYETDSVATTTATITLVDPEGTEITSVTPTLTNTTSTVQVDWEYTLLTSAVPGVWTCAVQTATALIAHDESTFRVLRAVG